MLYWDSSAIVASILNENISKEIDEFAKSFSSDCIYSAVMTPLEIESAIQRRLLEKSITEREADIARFTAAEFRKCVYLIASDFNVLDMALHMQKIYKLKPLDAIQLASARKLNSIKWFQFINFLHISQGSVAELETQIIISKNLQFFDSQTEDILLKELDEISRMIIGLQKSLRK